LQIKQVKDAAHFSLNSLKKDVLHTFEWIKYIQGRHNELERLGKHVQAQLGSMSESHEAFRERYHLLSEMVEKLGAIERRLERLEKRQPKVQPVDMSKFNLPAPKPADFLSKEVIKKRLVEIIKHNQPVQSTTLRDRVIKEGLTSKSTYYRFIAELLKEGRLKSEMLDREKVLRLA